MSCHLMGTSCFDAGGRADEVLGGNDSTRSLEQVCEEIQGSHGRAAV